MRTAAEEDENASEKEWNRFICTDAAKSAPRPTAGGLTEKMQNHMQQNYRYARTTCTRPCYELAHHQAGVAKCGIKTVASWALSFLMHQMLHWPDQFDEALWPFALEHAATIWNHLPKPCDFRLCRVDASCSGV